MNVEAPRGLLRFFNELKDPRMDRTKLHSLSDILVITICAVICGADEWTEVELFGKSKYKWFKRFLDLPNGIPSHDTFGRVFSLLDPKQLEHCFQRWMTALADCTGGQLIAVDGKTIRGSFDKANNKAAIHMVSAWSETNHLVLGQLATNAKSNEIKAIPQLLKMLDLTDSVITIDAMGCQKAITQQIVKQKGHYVLQVKKNHAGLYDVVEELFGELTSRGIPSVQYAFHEHVDAGHGRVETRRIWTTNWTDWYAERKAWKGLRSFVCVESIRELGNERSTERRYYISDLDGRNPKAMLGYVRGHWGIENKLHWSLDMTFREDDLRQRIGHSAENLSRIRRLALSLLRQDKSVKVGAKAKRLKACLEEDYLLRILCRIV